MDSNVTKYLATIGKKGGLARARKYSKATLRRWARKGGRPRKLQQLDKD